MSTDSTRPYSDLNSPATAKPSTPTATSRAMDKATDMLRSAADRARDGAASAVGSYTRQDPLRAVLIAAGVGALAMTVIAAMARSGARSVERRVRRLR